MINPSTRQCSHCGDQATRSFGWEDERSRYHKNNSCEKHAWLARITKRNGLHFKMLRNSYGPKLGMFIPRSKVSWCDIIYHAGEASGDAVDLISQAEWSDPTTRKFKGFTGTNRAVVKNLCCSIVILWKSHTTMKKKFPSQPIESRLLGRIEIRDGRAVFVPTLPVRTYKQIKWVPYYVKM